MPTLLTWRSSFENSVSRNVSTTFKACPGPITLAPIARILASLCSLVACALNVSWHSAARIPFILLAAIDMPIPVPHISIPLSHSPDTIALATFFA